MYMLCYKPWPTTNSYLTVTDVYLWQDNKNFKKTTSAAYTEFIFKFMASLKRLLRAVIFIIDELYISIVSDMPTR